MKKVIVQRLEDGSRCEYGFKSLADALEFIRTSELYPKHKAEDGSIISGAYEIYMPRMG